mgnify:CR=1 FL=1
MALSVELHKSLRDSRWMLLLSMMAAVLVFSAVPVWVEHDLKMIAGLVKPDSGKVIVDGRIVYDSAAKDRYAGKRATHSAIFFSSTHCFRQ